MNPKMSTTCILSPLLQMTSSLYILTLLVLWISAVRSADDPCISPNGQEGLCINIKQCSPLLEMLRTQRQQPGIADFLRASACGFEGRDPKVCCATGKPAQPPPPPRQPLVTRGAKIPDESECGFTRPDAYENRVVGGYPAKLGGWPWIAAIGYNSSSSKKPKYLCAGTLITSRHILTAGHCVYNRKDLYNVRIGDLDLDDDNDGATPIERLVVDKRVHEGYSSTTFENDIAILSLNEDVPFSELIRPICLPLSKELKDKNFVKSYPFLAGWGSTEFNGPSSSHLMQLQIPVVSEQSCKDALSRFSTARIDNRVLCAGFTRGGKDACQGDSGGPLVYPKYDHSYLIGVVSYGYKCAEPGYPGVYTKVTQFLDWIQNNLS